MIEFHRVLLVTSTLLLFLRSSSCLGCFSKSTLVSTVNVPSKEITLKGRKVKTCSATEGFWTTSTFDMDNSAVQSQGSISSISLTNQVLDPNIASGSSNNPGEFVNHGLIMWNQNRQRWIGNTRSENKTQQTQQTREPKLSWNATYESLLGSNKQFPQPIPLAEMIDFLVDIWEQEGLYD